MFRVLFSLLLGIVSFNIQAGEEAPPDQSSQYRETARISWKVGLSGSWSLHSKNQSTFQFPAVVELQLPVSNSYFKWLLHAGGGIIINRKTETVCDPSRITDPPKSPKPPFDSEFFQRIYEESLKNHEESLNKLTNPDTCFFKDQKVSRQYIPFLITQTGFKYGSDVYGVLQGGVMLSAKGDMGWTGELLIGKKPGLDISGGIKLTSFNNSLFVGAVFYLGSAIKSWWLEQSIE